MLPQLFRKTPLAWFQVTREKTRLLVAIARIAFADILMFVQLGFKDALFDSAAVPYQTLQSDLFLVNPRFETLFSTKIFSRERLLQAGAYERHLDSSLHTVGKQNTQKIERKHLT